jgi:hypothetical protein
LWFCRIKEINHLENVGVDGRIILKCVVGGEAWIGFMYLTIGPDGGLLRTRYRN